MIDINYGIGNSAIRSEGMYPTVSSLVNDLGLQAELGFTAESIETRTGGALIGRDAATFAGMALTLSKRAGEKSSDFMTSDQQLAPIAVPPAVTGILLTRVTTALEPLYVAHKADVAVINKEILEAQIAALEATEEYQAFMSAGAKALVTKGVLEAAPLPAPLWEEIKRIEKSFAAELEGLRSEVQDAEHFANLWRQSAMMDLSLCTTVASQRTVLANILQSDPLKPWIIEA